MATKPTYEELLTQLEALCDALRDYDRYGSDDDLAERNEELDKSVNLAARARKATNT